MSDEQVLFLADILPDLYEVGVLNGAVSPGDVVAIVGAGPIGLAAILTAGLFSPEPDRRDRPRRRPARAGSASSARTPRSTTAREDAVARIMELTDGLGADVASKRSASRRRSSSPPS